MRKQFLRSCLTQCVVVLALTVFGTIYIILLVLIDPAHLRQD